MLGNRSRVVDLPRNPCPIETFLAHFSPGINHSTGAGQTVNEATCTTCRVFCGENGRQSAIAFWQGSSMPKPNYRRKRIPLLGWLPLFPAMTEGNGIVIAPRWIKFGPRTNEEGLSQLRDGELPRPIPAGSIERASDSPRPPTLVKTFLDLLSKFVGARRHKFSEISLAPNSCRNPLPGPINARLSARWKTTSSSSNVASLRLITPRFPTILLPL